ncbi:2-amino-4-hydroxy-6-hydroxymethyldihydropteridine diphosphokinase [Chiayiivirga flava]|uniref:2-amino-4-hydroxy-6-hydroxymethyldihydropteridine pyrophosphokinase n=1 Tax=Chiayiivirga flava TaxID=659595 RepID=A0A7W8FZA9_9GAMM|nr:2-amino-4-hydroxy-6-hydroxymethyldihydropteridine diphosphokinase [Chiayiivirga flava]MBB5207009.1 2-amino-4-hydroxy-6-hydroxymethyldihydropteridine diphosphokinase [Chiayiivirga flava]
MSAAAPVRAFVGLGSNLGDPRDALARAFEALAGIPDTVLLRRSALYRTPPWGLLAQPDFINAVAELATELDAQTLLAHLRRIEHDAGRQRSERWGPRSLDLDLLLHGDTRVDTPDLQLPHPRMHERAFVLVPLADLAPALELPSHGRVADVLANLDRDGIEAVP